MDSLINASARALAAGDALGALDRVALREDPPALAMRGIAMAQLGENVRARELLRRAARGFGTNEELARARCIVAEAEVALAMRDLTHSPCALELAVITLSEHADHANALHAQLIEVRRLVLLGRLGEASARMPPLNTRGLPPALAAVAKLTEAELARRSLNINSTREALTVAHAAAEQSRVPALLAEVKLARAELERPAARLIVAKEEHMLRVDEVAVLLSSEALVIDACRRRLGNGNAWQSLARRPILFALARLLGEAWPDDVEREALIEHAFRTRYPDETHRARLRVEIGRLRALAKPWARIEATAQGFRLQPSEAPEVVVLAPPIEGEQASLVALLSDGAAWSTSALAMALGASQRTVQRALTELEVSDEVRAIGRGRSQRWLSQPLTGFTTILLLPTAAPIE